MPIPTTLDTGEINDDAATIASPWHFFLPVDSISSSVVSIDQNFWYDFHMAEPLNLQ